MTDSDTHNRDSLLVEYSATQQCISHYENMIWTIGSIFNAMVVGVIGFTAKIDKPNTLIVPILVSVWFHGLWFLFESRYRQINMSKFDRLWELEDLLGMAQNLRVKRDDEIRRFKPRAHRLISLVCFGFPTTLIVLYIALRLTQ